jgi:hypothetical protein
MKKFTFLIFAMVFAVFVANSQNFDLTFQVDMAGQVVNPAGVSVAGNFQVAAGYASDWTPGITVLSQVGATTVYELTVSLPAGYYNFKYINGDSWGQDESVPGECADGGNRFVDVSENTVLPVVCFGSCGSCTQMIDVVFRVNMANETISEDGVHIAGSFQGWDPGAAEMNLDYDAVYIYAALLPAGAYYEYKFINGNAWGNEEIVPGCCNLNGNRFINVPDELTTLDVVCFGSCSDCTEDVVDITFQVDLSGQDINVTDGVHLVGNFPGMEWDPGLILMDDMGNNIFASTQSLPVGFCLEYKFVNGDEWGEDESVPGECAMGFNRYMLVPAVNQFLDPVCFGSCTGCEGGTSDLFFSEYAEGSSSNKYVEIYNGTGDAVDLSEYQTHRIGNGGDWDENIYPLEGILQDGDVWVIANDQAADYIKDRADEFSSLTWFNGDDAIGLSKIVGDGYVIIDKIGDEGPDPGSGWGVAGVAHATKDHTLVRKDNVCGPNDDWASSAGTDVNNSEWIVYPKNTWDYLGFHVANCGGSPVVATPAFSENPGLVTAPFDLTITCDTPGATIFYTTDGSDPDFTSTEYTAAVNISVTTTVKAIAYAAGYGSSSIGEATYQFPVEVADLAALRAAAGSDAVFYELTGEVILTYQQDFRNQKYIQDATAAILIDDNGGVITTEYAIGDGITGLTGTLGEYGNMLQFIPVADPGAPTSSGNEIIPEVITINDMLANFEDYEAELVQIMAVSFNDSGETFNNGSVYDISDGSKAAGFFRATFYNVDYIGSGIAPYFNSLTGICNSRYDGEYITSRNLDDFDIPPTLIVVSPNGGEQIEQGTEFDITWDFYEFDANVSIALSTDETDYFEILVEDVPVGDKSYVWNVTQTYGDNYLINIFVEETDFIGDQSDNVFSIIPPIDIVITEIMYNPPESGSDTLEFIEFYNNGEGMVNLLDWEITQGVNFTFPDHIFNPGDYVIVCESASAFFNTFGLEVFEWDSGSLSNGGEDIELMDNAGIQRCYVDYDDGGSWYPVTDGEGPSLTFCDPDLENNDPVNWSASTKLAAINADGEGVYCTPLMSCNTDLVLPIWYPSGWTGISSNLMLLDKMSLEELFAPAYGNLDILVGETGIFWPGQSINTIGEWDTYKGYKVKFDGSTYFVFPGEELVDRSVTLNPGTYYLPVLSEGPVSVEEVIVPLGDAIEFMYDIVNTLVYWPAGGIVPGVASALETLYPGYGYLISVNETVTIDFGAAPPKGFSPISFESIQNITSWNDVAKTGDQHLISVMATENLESGDVIGTFNSGGVCTGMVSYTGNESVLSLVVFGDDQTTGEVDGMVGGEFMSIKIFRNGESIDVTAVYDMSFENHDGLFAQNGLSVIRDLKFGATGMGDQSAAYGIYPNPGNGLFNIQINGKYNVEVTNAHGQKVMSTSINGNDMLDLSNQPNGIYFIHLTNQTSTLTEKVIIR